MQHHVVKHCLMRWVLPAARSRKTDSLNQGSDLMCQLTFISVGFVLHVLW